MTDTDWQPADAAAAYNIPEWSEGYVAVGEAGHLLVQPRGAGGPAIDLAALTRRLPAEGLELPVLLRFGDILAHRIEALVGAFDEARAALDYKGGYTLVYPIKVNQQQTVVAGIVRAGGNRVGLEAGSKPELAAVLGSAAPGSVIVCNGYKDRAYIRRALIGEKLGHRVYIVIEKLSELAIVMREAEALDVAPRIGLRVRLAAISAGKWQNTGGERSKFGLSATQVLRALETLRAAERLDAVQMLHFHLGSQVANVGDIHRSMREAARFYAELRKAGAPVTVVDVGGGLGVDYEGTRSRSYCSMNYSPREYATAILRSLKDTCSQGGHPEPEVISESGRALTAHHAVLITDVVDVEAVPSGPVPAPLPEEPAPLQELHSVRGQLDARPPLESLYDAAAWLADVHSQYTHGLLDLSDRARAEQLYVAIAEGVRARLDPSIRAHREALDELEQRLARKYFCNFSVFQSLPDIWAIQQVFPILPIHRLDERPDQRVALCDLTCDSDGRIDHYVDRRGVEATMAAHSLRDDEPYWLGFFMVGAYQEILGDMHNLFGDTNAVNVVLDASAPEGWRLESPEQGDAASDLLRYVHFAPEALMRSYRGKINGLGLPRREASTLLAELEAGLSGYTYLSEA
jgi:arginine decarboxylase